VVNDSCIICEKLTLVILCGGDSTVVVLLLKTIEKILGILITLVQLVSPGSVFIKALHFCLKYSLSVAIAT